ncbi:MAG: alpha/beta fold hydrolase [Paracoccaceae bacterium]|nr:alpha/beta fold hydrolase [Paracoccaceae bacterium]
MPVTSVHCVRKVAASADAVWAVLRDFDNGWHPYVASCSLSRSATGAVLREFEVSDGARLVEQRTYFSDTDRVLCYTALSGVEGVFNYAARLEVTFDGAQSTIVWHAHIVARSDRIDAIADGTRAVFEAGLDLLEQDLPVRSSRKFKRSEPVATAKGVVSGTPRLSYLTSASPQEGGGALVLFLHGIGGQASNWTEQIATFGADYHGAAMDLRGYGGSTLGFSQTQIDDYCDDILVMARHFDATRLVLVGLSIGSWIATSFAMRHGDMLAGLVLAGGCTGMSEADPRERESFRISREVPLSQGQTPADFAGAVVDVITGPRASEDVRAALHKSMSDIPADTYRDALNCFCNPLETFEFSKLKCPVMLVTGAHDKLAPPDEIRLVSERIFDAVSASGGRADIRFEILTDAGHLCNLEQPEAFNAALDQFMQRLPNVAIGYKPTRSEKQRQKRSQILQAAHTEFCDAGFDGASMDRLAQAADVSKPTLYQYFGDKEGLFAAVLDEGRAHIIAPLAGTNGTLVDRLWQFSWTYARFVLRPDMLSLARLILGEAGRRPESALQYHQSGPARAFEGLVDFVVAADAAGELDVDDPKLAANDLWSLILSAPRDYYLHHVSERPTDSELLVVIGHGLDVFLKAYSNKVGDDRRALADKAAQMRAQLDATPQSLT